MAYTEPPVGGFSAGDIATVSDVNTYIVENIRALNARLGQGGQSLILRANQVVIGNARGEAAGLTIPSGALLVGTSGAPTTLRPGNTGQVLTMRGGTPRWESPNFVPNPALYVSF